jgi:hypothetical protein
LLKKWLFAAQDIFSDNASVRSAEKSQIFRALRSPCVIRGKNMIRAQSHCRSFSATCWKAAKSFYRGVKDEPGRVSQRIECAALGG